MAPFLGKALIFLLIFLNLIVLSGCAGFGKGVAEAVLEKTEADDVRICEVRGKAFTGIEHALDSSEGETKVLMVHGVGDHIPGYATEFLEKLGQELGLTVQAKKHKNISLTSPLDLSKKLGNLRISRLLNKSRTKELLFYELTWSEITKAEKALLAFDNSGEASFRRTEINDLMKKFANDTGPDPIIYLGKSRKDILTAFAQSFCWMTRGDWGGLPDEGYHACSEVYETSPEQILFDNYVLVSHSLGSRIVIDGMQFIASKLIEPSGNLKHEFSKKQLVIEALREQHIPVYMLSNQLPMLQLGRELPEFTGQKKEFCESDGQYFSQRMLSKTSIIAFSDPNDLLSYSIPSGFEDKYLDSRLCIDVTNIIINVAAIVDVFGLGKVANPLDAHIGYDSDDRVVALIAKGIGNHKTAPLINERCKWTELVD
jgi:hypothetical protein